MGRIAFNPAGTQIRVAVGRKMVARLAAAQRAYDSQHPNGHQPPALAYGVGLTYVSGG